jgi:hypothetical protein
MSAGRPTKAEHQFRLAQAKRRYAFLGGIEPARRLSKREREETQRQYKLEQKGDYRHMAETCGVLSLAEMAALCPAEMAVEGLMLKKAIEHIRHSAETGQEPVRGQDLVALVASDVPLSPFTRRSIANELARLYKSESEKPVSPKAKQQNKLYVARQLQIYFEGYVGMTATDAEQAAAEKIGLDVGALRKRRQRARKRKQQELHRPEFFWTVS